MRSFILVAVIALAWAAWMYGAVYGGRALMGDPGVMIGALVAQAPFMVWAFFASRR